MSGFIEIAKTNEVAAGEMKEISVKGREVLLANVSNQFYAVSNTCPHMAARLSAGTLKGTVITCPRHASQFDLKNGSVIRWTNWSGLLLKLSRILRAPRPLQTYPVKVSGDKVMVQLEP